MLEDKLKIVKLLKEENLRCKEMNQSTDFNHSASVFYLIDHGIFLYQDLIVNSYVIQDLIDEGIIKYKRKEKHQGLNSLRYILNKN